MDGFINLKAFSLGLETLKVLQKQIMHSLQSLFRIFFFKSN